MAPDVSEGLLYEQGTTSRRSEVESYEVEQGVRTKNERLQILLNEAVPALPTDSIPNETGRDETVRILSWGR